MTSQDNTSSNKRLPISGSLFCCLKGNKNLQNNVLLNGYDSYILRQLQLKSIKFLTQLSILLLIN